MYLECKRKKIFGIACIAKKLGFHTEFCELRIFGNLKNRSFSSGQPVV